MIKLLTITLLTSLIAGEAEYCFKNGLIYTLRGGVVIDSATVERKLLLIDKNVEDFNKRRELKKKIIEVIKTKPCK